MTVPFMHAYTELLVRTCHRRGAYAMGGMAAYIPSRRDPEANELALAKVAEDKEREANAGFDGTWVAHPDLIATAKAEFDRVMGDRPNQVDRQREDVVVTAEELLDVRVANGQITEEGVGTNVNVGIRYLASWLSGVGAATIDNLMEDAATAEISRSQIWQWVANGVTLPTGETVTAAKAREAIQIEMTHLREQPGEQPFTKHRLEQARTLFEEVALPPDFLDFLTLPAYELL
jgi:malate synthase